MNRSGSLRSAQRQPGNEPRAWTFGGHIASILVAGTAFATYYHSAFPPSGYGLEISWLMVLAHAFAHHWQWGVEIIFTYGPWGFLTPFFPYHPEIAHAFLIGQIVLCALWAVLVYCFVEPLGLTCKLLIVAALLAWYPVLGIDVGWYVPYALAAVMLYRTAVLDERTLRAGFAIATAIALLTSLALIKFTLMLMWAAFVGYATLMLLLHRRWRLATAIAIGAPLLLMTLWITSGQQLASLLAYVATSLDVSSGYGAMSLNSAYLDIRGAVALVVFCVVLAIAFLASPSRRAGFLAGSFFLFLSLLVWRAGFVRADNGHVMIFFATISLFGVIATCMPLRSHPMTNVLRWGALVILSAICLWTTYEPKERNWSVAGIWSSLATITSTSAIDARNRSAWDANEAAAQMPRTRALVGNHSIDVLMNEQAIALLNDLNYRPRPVFQSYVAYTPKAARLNEARLLSEVDAPEFLLMKLDSLDEHLPTGDDPLSVLAALRRYRPVNVERGFAVMQKTALQVSAIQPPSPNAWKTATLGKSIALEGDGQQPQGSGRVLFFDVCLSALGILHAALLREARLDIELTLTDGAVRSYELVRKLGPVGMLVSPHFSSEQEYLAWYADVLKGNSVASVRLRAHDKAGEKYFQSDFGYALVPIEIPRSNVSMLPAAVQKSFFPGFSLMPIGVEGAPLRVVNEAGRDVLFAHAPSAFTFNLAPGRWTLHGEFGLLSSAYECAQSDGIAVVVEKVAADGGVHALYQRLIDPVHRPTERGAQMFDLDAFDVGPADTIRVRNAPGLDDKAKSDCDWSYLGKIDFERVSGTHDLNN